MTYVAISDRGDIAILTDTETLDQAVDDAHIWYLQKYYNNTGKLPAGEITRYCAILSVDDGMLNDIITRNITAAQLVKQESRRVIEITISPPPDDKADGARHTTTAQQIPVI